MTLETEDLRRSLEADPGNEALKQKLVQAYIRENRKDDARDLVKGFFHCPLKWDDLTETDSEEIRDCEQCEKQVHFVWTLPNLHDKVVDDHCIGAPERLVNEYAEAVVSGRIHNTRAREAECVFESALPIIEDLEDLDIDRELCEVVHNEWHNRYQVLPIGIRDGVLEVASHTPIPQADLESLRAKFPEAKAIKQYLALKEQLLPVIQRYLRPPAHIFLGGFFNFSDRFDETISFTEEES